MKRVLGFVAGSLLLAGSALAADLPVKALPMAAAAPNWTGWYLGVTAGYGWSDQGINDSGSPFCTENAIPTYKDKHKYRDEHEVEAIIIQQPHPCPAFGNALGASLPTHFSTDPKGFIGGGEIGYNAQLGRWVLGVEADLSGADIKGSDTQTLSSKVAGFPGSTVTVQGTASEKLDFFATLRGRFGYTLMPQLLVYGTAGVALGHVSASTTLTESATGCCTPASQTVAASSSATLPGWTAGGGLEWMLAPHWTLKGEYLYYDLGTLSYALPDISQAIRVPGFTGTLGANNITSHARVTGNIARVGLNYKF
jgi:outer membrane immunogenic protein